MRLVLTGTQQLALQENPPSANNTQAGSATVHVLACGVCRTDAKMWHQGHRDLTMPRVLGHEMVVRDDSGARFIVWPGNSCGTCRYCTSGRDNLCDQMKITGFHSDGGFADSATLPTESLIPIDDEIDNHSACFAEPAGCVINAFSQLSIAGGERVLIWGAGTLGLLAALYARHLGLRPRLIERDGAKKQKIRGFLEQADIDCCLQDDDSDDRYELAINTCADPGAFSELIKRTDKGGQISFFSGLNKDQKIDTNILNQLHYKEIRLSGAYGLKKADMSQALPFLRNHQAVIPYLIEEVISLQRTAQVMPAVLSGQGLRYIVDHTLSEE